MDDNRMLILAVLAVLVIGGVAFASNGFTGAATRSGVDEKISKVCVSSDDEIACEKDPTVGIGNYVYITVETGSEGASNIVGFYDKNGPNYKRRSTMTLTNQCGGTSCRDNRITSEKYKIPVDWSGRYCARIFDRALGKQVEDCFFVK
ncbi:hypothetical protein HYX15_03690 [Candidatus Woesearchaeota archaeon]|nr:hypothetical protein [Candidatus Woesearchaeota archaeon]